MVAGTDTEVGTVHSSKYNVVQFLYGLFPHLPSQSCPLIVVQLLFEDSHIKGFFFFSH